MATEAVVGRKTVGNILFDSGDSFKRYMTETNLKKVVSAMLEKKVLKKKLGRLCMKKHDADLLLADMKHNMNLDNFLGYLEVLTEFGSYEGYDGETRKLMRVMKGSLEEMKPEPNSPHDAIIKRFIAVALSRSDQPFSPTEQTQLEGSQLQDQTQITKFSPQSTIEEIQDQQKDLTVTDTIVEPSAPDPNSHVSEAPNPKETLTETTVEPPVSDSNLQLQDQTQTTHVEITSPQPTSVIEEMQDLTITDTIVEPSVPDPKSHISEASEAVIETTVELPTSDSDRPYTSSTGPPNRPPAGQFGDAISHFFTSEGGVLYSPVHGAMATIPPNAIPADVGKFNLSMHFYLGRPFTTEEGVYLCSGVVWFHHRPSFEFLEDVIVKIPYAASTDPTSLRVLTWGEDKQGPPYKLDTEVPADFSDGYHAVFKVKHFSPFVVAKTTCYSEEALHKKKLSAAAFRKRAGTGSGSGSFSKSLQRMKSDSVEKSFEEGLITVVGRSGSAESTSSGSRFSRQDAVDRTDSPVTPEPCVRDSGIRYSIACSMPRDRSGEKWEVNFAVCYSHPTGNWLLRQFAESKFGSELDFYMHEDVTIRNGSIQLSLAGMVESPWTVAAPAGLTILESQIQKVPEISFASGLKTLVLSNYPPNVSLTVSRNRDSHRPAVSLQCEVEARGALTVTEETPSFLITSTVPINKNERVLSTCTYLYEKDSDVMRVLMDSANDVVLNTSDPDPIKLLADFSLQLQLPSNCEKVKIFSEKLDKHTLSDDSFEALGNWVCIKEADASLKGLLRQLEFSRVVLEKRDPNVLLNKSLDKKPVDCELFDELALGLKVCWKEVAYLMGIPPTDVDDISNEGELDRYVQCHKLLCTWQKRKDQEATYGILFKAVHRMFRYRPMKLNAAHKICVRSANKLLSRPPSPQPD